MRRMRLFVVLLVAGLWALPVLAQDQVLVEYYQGSYHFDYDQWPFGGYGGTFDAAGEILDPDIGWAEGQTESVGGRMEVLSDTLTTWAYGAILNADTTVDVAAVFVRTAGATLNPGNYPVDLDDYMALYAFFDNVSDFTIPEEGGNMAEWLANLVADHTFFATTGSITITQIDEEGLAGSFTGLMADPGDFTIVSVSNASFAMDGQVPTDVPDAPAFASRGSFPNPFNPKTTLRFEMPEAGRLSVRVFDAAGRELAMLADGSFPAGAQELIWDGRDAAGRPLPGGVYLYRIESDFGSASGKMTLLK